MKSGSVAVIDVGSNTIKLLVAKKDAAGALTVVHQASVPVRIGSGIGSDHPAITAESLKAGIVTIEQLLEEANSHSPTLIRVVATGAVRDASNGKRFAEKVEDATGHPLEVLSGDEEAFGIATGLVTDPVLGDQQDFLACDLGGGSLELILVEKRSPKAAVSLSLGAILLTERFIASPKAPVPASETQAISRHVIQTLAESKFPFPETPPILMITGGSFFTARVILAEREGIPFEKRFKLNKTDFSMLLEETVSLSLEERYQRFPGLPPNRADVMAAAFTCIIALFDHLKIVEGINCLRNLRYGIAIELLAQS
ncbi:MAG: phosphatase [Opitutales bacterium]